MLKRRDVSLRVGLVLALVAVLALPVSAERVGGYVYNQGEARFIDNVWNFIKWFAYEQYYWTEAYEFTSYNNWYIDAMDVAYYSGHGNYWYIGMGPGSSSPQYVSTPTAGAWGDNQLEFIIFQSCQVLPSIPDVANWWSNWAGSGRPFQGLHQAIGYRTNSYSGNGISNNFGWRVKVGQAMWQAWFAAVNDERAWWKGANYPGYASVMLYPGLDNDTRYYYGADPPANHTWLRTYYQY